MDLVGETDKYINGTMPELRAHMAHSMCPGG